MKIRAFLAVLVLGASTLMGAAAARPAAPSVPVVLVLLENHSRSAITAKAAPYLTSFAAAGRTFTGYNAIEHPSLPNYLDLTIGSNAGCRSDSCARESIGAASIFQQVGDWQAWNDAMPRPCDQASTGTYAVKHNAPPYLTNLRSTCAARDIGYPAHLPASLPAFTFITPSLVHDMHSASVAKGDAWMAQHVPALLSKGVIVIVVFDEGSGSQNVYAAEQGPGIPSGVTDTGAYNHYSLLAGLEDWFGVPRLAHAVGARALPL